MDNNSFINLLLPYALKQKVVLPSVLIAQSALETGFGKHIFHNNYFGIKSNSKNSSHIAKTYEYINSKKVQTICRFKAYSSLENSINDYTNLMLNPRYLRVHLAKDYIEACNALILCGYATDPNYSKKLNSIIEKYKLFLWDVSCSNFAVNPRIFVVENNISDGTNPKKYSTREEVWTMLYRLYLFMK